MQRPSLFLPYRWFRLLLPLLHPLKLLKQNIFKPFLLSGPLISSYAINRQKLDKMNRALGNWIDEQMQACDDVEQAAFILKILLAIQQKFGILK